MAKWVLRRKGGDYEGLGEKFGVDPLVIRLLLNRGVDTEEKIRRYLHGKEECFHDPSLLKDAEKACRILEEKCRSGARIRVMGDYDIDGVCATAVLVKGLKLAGADVDAVIPHRIHDGYGLNVQMVERAFLDGVDTVVTCDNGISAADAVQKAKEHGMTVIVTDHHEVPFEEADGQKTFLLPGADAVVDPKQEDCAYPFPEICGANVACKLMHLFFEGGCLERLEGAAEKRKQWQELKEELVMLAAFATIGDVMPLCDENRALVKLGLKLLEKTGNPGMKALLDVCGLHGASLQAYHVGFRLGPCLNATGRIESADRALDLLLAQDVNEAVQLAGDLEAMNNSRKLLTEKGLAEAVHMVEQEGFLEDRVLVLYLPGCHESVAGIIAGRLREKYERPAFVLTDAETEAQDALLKGSGRSVPAYHMYHAMSEVKEIFEKFGGHAQAAGFSIKKENLSLMRELLNRHCSVTLEEMEETVRIDADAPFAYCSRQLVEQLSLLEPFGNGNDRPLFARKDLVLKSARLLGEEGKAGRYRVQDKDGQQYELTLFQKNGQMMEFLAQKYGKEKRDLMFAGKYHGDDMRITAAYYPKINEYKGRQEVQFILTNYC